MKTYMEYLDEQFRGLYSDHGHKEARVNRKELVMEMSDLAQVLAIAQQLSRIATTLESIDGHLATFLLEYQNRDWGRGG